MYQEVSTNVSADISVKYRWSIGKVSVKYRWTPTISTDRSVGRYIGGHPTDISTDTRPCIGRYSTDPWSSVGQDVGRYSDRYIGRGPP